MSRLPEEAEEGLPHLEAWMQLRGGFNVDGCIGQLNSWAESFRPIPQDVTN